MLFSVEQAFVGRDEKRAPLKTPAWEASLSLAKQISYAGRPVRSTNQIGVVARHQYGITSHSLLRRHEKPAVAWQNICCFLTRTDVGYSNIPYLFFLKSILKVGTFVYSIKYNPAKNIWNWFGPCYKSADP